MLFQLAANEWRILRRLHLAGGKAKWNDIRPLRRKSLEDHFTAVLVLLRLVEIEGDTWRITKLGSAAQELGEADASLDVLTKLPKWNNPPMKRPSRKKGRKK